LSILGITWSKLNVLACHLLAEFKKKTGSSISNPDRKNQASFCPQLNLAKSTSHDSGTKYQHLKQNISIQSFMSQYLILQNLDSNVTNGSHFLNVHRLREGGVRETGQRQRMVLVLKQRKDVPHQLRVRAGQLLSCVSQMIS